MTADRRPPRTVLPGAEGKAIRRLEDWVQSMLDEQDSLDARVAALEAAPPGGVTSVFGRIGVVTAQAGDYAVAQVTGAVPDTRQVIAGTGLTGGGTLAADRTLTVTYGTSGSSACVGNDSRLSDARTPTAHASTHLPGGTDALTTAAAGAITPGDSAAVGSAASFARSDHRHSIAAFGTTAGTFCQGNDSRLSDARQDAGFPTDITGDITVQANYDIVVGQPVTLEAGASLTLSAGSSMEFLGDNVSGVWLGSAAAVGNGEHPLDDHFTGTSLDSKWTTWDPGNYQTRYVSDSWLTIYGTGNGNKRFGGIYQKAPDSEFAIYAYSAMLCTKASTTLVGLFVAPTTIDTSPTTNALALVDVNVSASATTIDSGTFTAYTAVEANSATLNSSWSWLRLRCNGTTAFFDASLDGKTWIQVQTLTLGFTPTRVGLCLRADTNAVVSYAKFNLFRYFGGAGSSGMDSTHIGGTV